MEIDREEEKEMEERLERMELKETAEAGITEYYQDEIEELEKRVEDLETENRELQKDKARLDFVIKKELRIEYGVNYKLQLVRKKVWFVSSPLALSEEGEDLRSIIDKVMEISNSFIYP